MGLSTLETLQLQSFSVNIACTNERGSPISLSNLLPPEMGVGLREEFFHRPSTIFTGVSLAQLHPLGVDFEQSSWVKLTF